MITRRLVSKIPFVVRSMRASRYISTTVVRLDREKVAETEVPVMTYAADDELHAAAKDGQQTVLTVDASKPSLSASPTMDVVKQAFALEKSVVDHLTPTLKKFTLHGKVAVITGGARGLGYNMAQALCEVGVKAIAIMDVQQDLGDQSAAELHESTGIPVQFYKVDVRDAGAIQEVVANVVESFGSVDVLINSAGIADSNIKAEEYDPEKFRRLIDINVTGSFLVAQACGRAMISAGNGGSIILIASMSGSIVNYPQEQSCYNASKAA
ncbi:MAG: hypothetical protein M1830_006608, partial [Pleopsidium flavum]